jgi:hypothetical protein
MPTMRRHRLVSIWLAGLCLVLASAAAGRAAQPTASLLPRTTSGYFATRDVKGLKAAWEQTTYGQILADPQMQPFVSDMRRQIQEQWLASQVRLGIHWADIEEIAAGEACTAMIPGPQGRPAAGKPAVRPLPVSMVLVDVTGKTREAAALLERVAQNLVAQQAKRREVTVEGTKITVLDLAPRTDGMPSRGQGVYFIKDEMLCAADDLAMASAVVQRWNDPQGKLAGDAAYTAVMQRCETDAAGQTPEATWFVVPLNFMEDRRAVGPQASQPRDTDTLKILRNQGFDGITGAGGFVHLSEGEYDVYYRVAVHAPRPWRLALRMIELPNVAPQPPEAWVPGDTARYVTLNLDIQNVFAMCESLVDEFYGAEGVFADSLESLREDENGPQIDVEKDLIAHLGRRVTLVFDYVRPIQADSEQRLIAIETTNPVIVATTVEKDMRANRGVKVHEIAGAKVWEVPEEQEARERKPRGNPRGPRRPARPPAEQPKQAPMTTWVAVARGCLLVASHRAILEKALTDRPAEQTLAYDATFVRVDSLLQAEVERRGWQEGFLRTYERTDRAFEASYEMARLGLVRSSNSLGGRLLKNWSDAQTGEEHPVRPQQLDASKLPPYDPARHQFGPSAWCGVTEADGWFAIGFTLKGDVRPVGAAATAAEPATTLDAAGTAAEAGDTRR